MKTYYDSVEFRLKQMYGHSFSMKDVPAAGARKLVKAAEKLLKQRDEYVEHYFQDYGTPPKKEIIEKLDEEVMAILNEVAAE